VAQVVALLDCAMPCRLAVNKVWPQPSTGNVIPVEISGRPTVGKADLEAAAQRYGFVGNDADVTGHSRY